MPNSRKNSSSSSPAPWAAALEEIRVTDFGVAREVSLQLKPGLTVFTGETGAGKSLVVDALAFAFGARRGREVIATGAERATVHVSWGNGSEHLERTVSRTGRATARHNGSVATNDDLLALAAQHIDVHGQSEQTAILRTSEQRDLLDAFAGTLPLRGEVGELARELRAVRRRIQSLSTDQREREREITQLRFESGEILAAGLRPGEDDEVRGESHRLANADRLLEAATAALDALADGSIGNISAAAGEISERDASATEIRDIALLFESTADDLARAIRGYRDAIDLDPERLTELSERLDVIARLKRKYGDTVDDVLAYADRALARLEELGGANESIEELEARVIGIQEELRPLVADLSAKRREAAARLVAAVGDELEALGMERANLAVGFACNDDADGIEAAVPDFEVVTRDWTPGCERPESMPRALSEYGIDRVEFLASFNPGEAARPLAAVASGGETSRFLLALSAVLSASAEPRVIVFDEVDEGVGGRAGSLVGAALRRLSERHQVLCITHLPQVAAFGDTHFRVTKTSDETRTWSEVVEVDGDARASELAAMLGGETEATLTAAGELLEAAREGQSGVAGKASRKR